MSPWVANTLGLSLVALFALFLGISLFWRIAQWQMSPAARLTFDEGLRVGSKAPQIAALSGDNDMHLSFGGSPTFVVFGNMGCRPCHELLEAAAIHPATRSMRLVFLTNDDGFDDVPADVLGRWEMYRYHNELLARKAWRAQVSPYFYVIDADGRIAEKGVANLLGHLDRLLALAPPTAVSPTLSVLQADTREEVSR